MGKDNVLIAVPTQSKQYFLSKGIPENLLLDHGMQDIWMRDSTPVNMNRQALFTFRPKYISGSEGRVIQGRVLDLM